MRLLIYGSKDFSNTVTDLARHCGHEVAGKVDDFDCGPDILGSFESVKHNFLPSEYGFAIAVGYSNMEARWKVWQRVSLAGYKVPALLHPRAYVADNAIIGAGSMVMAGALVDVRARLGEISVIWPGACISHDCEIGANSFVSPNATLCGFVRLGNNCFVGAGSAIVDHCTVPSSTYIKMLSKYVGSHA